MYTLRRITGTGTQMHFALGRTYNFVDRLMAEDDFRRCAVDLYGTLANLPPEVYAFVTDHGGENCYPIYEGQAAFIMNENGKTFANVSSYEKHESPAKGNPMNMPVADVSKVNLKDIFDWMKQGRPEQERAYLQDCIDNISRPFPH